MKNSVWMTIIGFLIICPLAAAGSDLSADEIMTALEARYDVPGFKVRFLQVSTIAALDISDEAEGRIYIKQPGRMRWEYETPVPQSIITDGTSLWVWAPDDNQVMMGKASTFFGEGKGGAFLSDMSALRESFTVEKATGDPAECYTLRLIPATPTADIKEIRLTVSKEDFTIRQVSTEYTYDEIVRMTFTDTDFELQLDDGMFIFSPPVGADIVSLEE